MIRKVFIERIRRLIYGGQPPSEASITVNLVNNYLGDAIAAAAKANYIESIKIDGISYVNSSFYTTFKGISITADEQFLWKIALPQIPVGIGENDGTPTVIIKDSSSPQLSYPIILISQKQKSFHRGMRAIPNKLVGYPEGNAIFIESTLMLSDYTAQVTMVSGGDNTDLDSTLNVPSDYFPAMTEYLKTVLMFQRTVPQDVVNDGSDIVRST